MNTEKQKNYLGESIKRILLLHTHLNKGTVFNFLKELSFSADNTGSNNCLLSSILDPELSKKVAPDFLFQSK